MKTTILKTLILFLLITTFFSCKKNDPVLVDNTTVPTLTTLAITDITPTSAISGGDITATGGADIITKGVCWSTSPEPTILDFATDDGNNSSKYTSNITGLTANTTYYVRAYATNSKGTAYGNELELEFVDNTTVPTLTTLAITDITPTSATSGGDITATGGADIITKGVCWSTSPEPTILDFATDDGNNSSKYTSNITGLTANTTYYVRAYATNSKGTGYGNELEFVDNTTVPTLTTLAITDITFTSATSGGDITATGGTDITAKGVCWSTSPNPTILDFATDEGNNPSNYTSSITGLTVNTTYYVRAYATNSKGTGYGNELGFIIENIFPGEKVAVAGGTFDMGSTAGSADEAPIHSVTLSDFSISKYEITNAQYAIFMNDIEANIDGSFNGVEYLDMDTDIQISHTGGQFVVDAGKENNPVIEVSWFGAKAYSEHYGGRLPTEAEWEFAAKGGNSSSGYTYSGSNTIDDVAWYVTNSGSDTHAVGTKSANELGVHDMSGNVWEWTNDWFDANYYSNSPSSNPQGPATGTSRVARGGSWDNSAINGRVAERTNSNPASTYNIVGFRPVFVP